LLDNRSTLANNTTVLLPKYDGIAAAPPPEEVSRDDLRGKIRSNATPSSSSLTPAASGVAFLEGAAGAGRAIAPSPWAASMARAAVASSPAKRPTSRASPIANFSRLQMSVPVLSRPRDERHSIGRVIALSVIH
jgi:hypothetical protein